METKVITIGDIQLLPIPEKYRLKDVDTVKLEKTGYLLTITPVKKSDVPQSGGSPEDAAQTQDSEA